MSLDDGYAVTPTTRRKSAWFGNVVCAVPIVEFHVIISDHPEPLSLFPFRAFGHYSVEGYALLASQVEKRLARDGFVPSASP